MTFPLSMNRRDVLRVLGTSATIFSAPAFAEWKPARPIECVVAASPGGGADIYARVMQHVLQDRKLLGGQPFIVNNRPGGAGNIAAGELLRNPGEANVFTMYSTSFALAQVTGDFRYDLLQDFTIGPTLIQETMVVGVRADSPLKTGADLVAMLHKDPGSLRIAVAPLMYGHVHAALLKPLSAAGVRIDKLTVATYRSSGDSVVALMGGHIDVVTCTSTTLSAQLKAGSVRCLAVTGKKRLAGVYANVPTWLEQGVNASYHSVVGIMFPRGVPLDQLVFWDNRFRALSDSAEWTNALDRNGVTPYFLPSVNATRLVASEVAESRTLLAGLLIGHK